MSILNVGKTDKPWDEVFTKWYRALPPGKKKEFGRAFNVWDDSEKAKFKQGLIKKQRGGFTTFGLPESVHHPFSAPVAEAVRGLDPGYVRSFAEGALSDFPFVSKFPTSQVAQQNPITMGLGHLAPLLASIALTRDVSAPIAEGFLSQAWKVPRLASALGRSPTIARAVGGAVRGATEFAVGGIARRLEVKPGDIKDDMEAGLLFGGLGAALMTRPYVKALGMPAIGGIHAAALTPGGYEEKKQAFIQGAIMFAVLEAWGLHPKAARKAYQNFSKDARNLRRATKAVEEDIAEFGLGEQYKMAFKLGDFKKLAHEIAKGPRVQRIVKQIAGRTENPLVGPPILQPTRAEMRRTRIPQPRLMKPPMLEEGAYYMPGQIFGQNLPAIERFGPKLLPKPEIKKPVIAGLGEKTQQGKPVSTTAKTAPTVEQEVKQPWEMSREEFYADQMQGFKKNLGLDLQHQARTYLTPEVAAKAHEKYVKQAIKQGKITSHPDYPGLGKSKVKPPDTTDSKFYAKVLRNRTNIEKLRSWGIESTKEADSVVAMMQAGSSKNDALYTIRSRRTVKSTPVPKRSKLVEPKLRKMQGSPKISQPEPRIKPEDLFEGEHVDAFIAANKYVTGGGQKNAVEAARIYEKTGDRVKLSQKLRNIYREEVPLYRSGSVGKGPVSFSLDQEKAKVFRRWQGKDVKEYSASPDDVLFVGALRDLEVVFPGSKVKPKVTPVPKRSKLIKPKTVGQEPPLTVLQDEYKALAEKEATQSIHFTEKHRARQQKLSKEITRRLENKEGPKPKPPSGKKGDPLIDEEGLLSIGIIPFGGKSRKRRVLSIAEVVAAARANQPDFTTEQGRAELLDLKPAGDPSKLGGIGHNLSSYVRPVRHSFRTMEDRFQAFTKVYHRIRSPSKFMGRHRKEVIMGLKKVAGRKMLADKSAAERIDKWLEDESVVKTTAKPSYLSAAEWKTGKWLRKEYDRLHKFYHIKGYLKNYSPHRRELVDQELGDLWPDKAPYTVKWWADKMRSEETMEGMERNAFLKFQEYVNSGSKRFYMKKSVQEVQKHLKGLESKKVVVGKTKKGEKIFRTEQSSQAKLFRKFAEDWVTRIMGYPAEGDIRLANSLVKTMKAVGVKMDVGTAYSEVLKRSNQILNASYTANMGARPFLAFRNLYQNLHNYSILGERDFYNGLKSVVFKDGMKIADDAGIFIEYAPELYKKISLTKTKGESLRDVMMFMFQHADKINRAVSYNGALARFDRFYKAGKIEQILKKMDKPEASIVRDKIKKGDIDRARHLYSDTITGITQYFYNKEDAAPITRTKAGRHAWQYQTWWQNYTELWAHMMRNRRYDSMLRLIFSSLAVGGLTAMFGKELKKKAMSESQMDRTIRAIGGKMERMPTYLLHNTLPWVGSGYGTPEFGGMPIGPTPGVAIVGAKTLAGKTDKNYARGWQKFVANTGTAFIPGGSEMKILLRTYYPELYKILYAKEK